MKHHFVGVEAVEAVEVDSGISSQGHGVCGDGGIGGDYDADGDVGDDEGE